ncbi:MAG: tetratricopeptide repeat protein [Holophagaceae bacterium]|nr:tetratricopeptide repeat protein [Holophagaceae bacterium]
MSDEKRQEAMELMGKAYQLHMKGEVDGAIELYDKSLAVLPTPEAYTFRGWAKSFGRDFEGAIEDCHLAIDLDPEFGNPYNDIGAYYLELGEPEDAIPWLKMALKAKRYESYCFPHYNLGRIFEAAGQLDLARQHFGQALESNPGYALAAKALRRVQEKLTAQDPKEARTS